MQTQDAQQLLSLSAKFGCKAPREGRSCQYLPRAVSWVCRTQSCTLLAHICPPLAGGAEELSYSYVHPPHGHDLRAAHWREERPLATLPNRSIKVPSPHLATSLASKLGFKIPREDSQLWGQPQHPTICSLCAPRHSLRGAPRAMQAGRNHLYLMNPLPNLRQQCQVCVSYTTVGIHHPGRF